MRLGTVHGASGDMCLTFRTPLQIGTREYHILIYRYNSLIAQAKSLFHKIYQFNRLNFSLKQQREMDYCTTYENCLSWGSHWKQNIDINGHYDKFWQLGVRCFCINIPNHISWLHLSWTVTIFENWSWVKQMLWGNSVWCPKFSVCLWAKEPLNKECWIYGI